MQADTVGGKTTRKDSRHPTPQWGYWPGRSLKGKGTLAKGAFPHFPPQLTGANGFITRLFLNSSNLVHTNEKILEFSMVGLLVCLS